MKRLLLLVCLVGCTTTPTQTKKQAAGLEYYKDTRTNLCFVRNIVYDSNGFGNNVFSNVPCTPEVEQFVTK